MSSTEIFERANNRELPFANIRLGDSEKHYLNVLHLNKGSTAEDVRRVAITTRAKMGEGCIGLNGDSLRSLFWTLDKTNDCINEQEFFRFLLKNSTFEEIEVDR